MQSFNYQKFFFIFTVKHVKMALGYKQKFLNANVNPRVILNESAFGSGG